MFALTFVKNCVAKDKIKFGAFLISNWIAFSILKIFFWNAILTSRRIFWELEIGDWLPVGLSHRNHLNCNIRIGFLIKYLLQSTSSRKAILIQFWQQRVNQQSLQFFNVNIFPRESVFGWRKRRFLFQIFGGSGIRIGLEWWQRVKPNRSIWNERSLMKSQPSSNQVFSWIAFIFGDD